MTKCVTLNGEIIHIGEWDFQIQQVLVPGTEEDPLYDDVTTNPFPEGAIYEDKDLAFTADEKYIDLHAPTAYQDLRRPEYPSLANQLDALWKGGTEADAMRLRVMAVKVKYPKP